MEHYNKNNADTRHMASPWIPGDAQGGLGYRIWSKNLEYVI